MLQEIQTSPSVNGASGWSWEREKWVVFCKTYVPWLFSADKKNENKEVAVNDFLGAKSAVEAIAYSMDLYASFVVESLRQ
jgi:hypothetical protein